MQAVVTFISKLSFFCFIRWVWGHKSWTKSIRIYLKLINCLTKLLLWNCKLWVLLFIVLFDCTTQRTSNETTIFNKSEKPYYNQDFCHWSRTIVGQITMSIRGIFWTLLNILEINWIGVWIPFWICLCLLLKI